MNSPADRQKRYRETHPAETDLNRRNMRARSRALRKLREENPQRFQEIYRQELRAIETGEKS